LECLNSAASPLSLSALRAALNLNEIGQLIDRSKVGLLEDLYLVNITDEAVVAELRAIVEPTLTWVHSMYSKGLQALMQEGNQRGPPKAAASKDDIFLSSVESSEESIFSAVLGMKGQIDLVAKARVIQLPEGVATAGLSAAQLKEVAESALPVEIKTGKWRASTAIGHRAQVESCEYTQWQQFIALTIRATVVVPGDAVCAADDHSR
jgi:hypothetical protein